MSCAKPSATFERFEILAADGLGGTEVDAMALAAFVKLAAARCGCIALGLVVAAAAKSCWTILERPERSSFSLPRAIRGRNASADSSAGGIVWKSSVVSVLVTAQFSGALQILELPSRSKKERFYNDANDALCPPSPSGKNRG